MDQIKVGSTVKPTRESGEELTSGSNLYHHAVVINLDPFILVSEESDMMWRRTIKIEDFEYEGCVSDDILLNCMRRDESSRIKYLREKNIDSILDDER